MGKILIGGVKYAKSEGMKVSRSGGSGGSENVTTVVAEKTVLSDTPPEPVCINIEDGLGIDCITVVAEADEKCIFMGGDIPSIDVTPDITEPDGCNEFTEQPTFEVVSVNGKPLVLDENVDDEGIVYVQQDDVTSIMISNYDENIIYDTPYTDHDNKFQEHLGSNYLFDNGGGQLIFIFTKFYSLLDGVDVNMWIYATDGDKCRNRNDDWMGVRTMEKSIKPILKCSMGDSSVTIVNYSSENRYVDLYGYFNGQRIEVMQLNDQLYATDSACYGIPVQIIIYASVIEPLKYKSDKSSAYIYITCEIVKLQHTTGIAIPNYNPKFKYSAELKANNYPSDPLIVSYVNSGFIYDDYVFWGDSVNNLYSGDLNVFNELGELVDTQKIGFKTSERIRSDKICVFNFSDTEMFTDLTYNANYSVFGSGRKLYYTLYEKRYVNTWYDDYGRTYFRFTMIYKKLDKNGDGVMKTFSLSIETVPTGYNPNVSGVKDSMYYLQDRLDLVSEESFNSSYKHGGDFWAISDSYIDGSHPYDELKLTNNFPYLKSEESSFTDGEEYRIDIVDLGDAVFSKSDIFIKVHHVTALVYRSNGQTINGSHLYTHEYTSIKWELSHDTIIITPQNVVGSDLQVTIAVNIRKNPPADAPMLKGYHKAIVNRWSLKEKV